MAPMFPEDPYSSRFSGQEKVERHSRFYNCALTATSGFGMGATLGLTVGVLFGGLQALSPQYKGRRLAIISGQCVQYGGLFGIILAAGAVIRGGC